MLTVKDFTNYLETIAHPSYQESYDNSGLVIGNPEMPVTGVIVCLDSIEEVVDEAIQKACNLIVAHHPIIFSGLKKINGKNYVEKTVIKAIQNEIAIYAIHTNLDNMLVNGVNSKIAEMLGMQNCKILQPKSGTLMKLTSYVPIESKQTLLNALYEAGAGQIGDYKDCSFSSIGTGNFTPVGDANPSIGKLNQPESVEECKIELLISRHNQNNILQALKDNNPYEEVAYYLHEISNVDESVGAGLLGEISEELDVIDFIKSLKQKLNVTCVRYTTPATKNVKKIAICGGAGSFLLKDAIGKGADIFISSDFKYHEFFDAENRITIADIGHFESEQYTIQLLFDIINKKFSNFAVHLTEVVTNPVKYL